MFAPGMIYFLGKHTKSVSPVARVYFTAMLLVVPFCVCCPWAKLALWRSHKVKINLGSGTFFTKRSSQWILLPTTKLLASATVKEVIAAPDGWDALLWNVDPGVHTLSSPAWDAANLVCAKCLWGFFATSGSKFSHVLFLTPWAEPTLEWTPSLSQSQQWGSFTISDSLWIPQGAVQHSF